MCFQSPDFNMVMIAACKFLFERAAIFRSLRENVERRDRQANSRVRRNSQAGAGTGFWMAMRRGLGSDDAFKEAVIRDNEIVALVAGLLTTVAFAGLLVPMEGADGWRPALRLTYLSATFAAVGLSLSATVIAVRTIVLVNSAPASSCLFLLEHVQQGRLWHKLNPFMLTAWSVTPLLFACCLFTGHAYGLTEFVVAALLSTLTVEYLDQENSLHFQARMAALEHASKDNAKE